MSVWSGLSLAICFLFISLVIVTFSSFSGEVTGHSYACSHIYVSSPHPPSYLFLRFFSITAFHILIMIYLSMIFLSYFRFIGLFSFLGIWLYKTDKKIFTSRWKIKIYTINFASNHNGVMGSRLVFLQHTTRRWASYFSEQLFSTWSSKHPRSVIFDKGK